LRIDTEAYTENEEEIIHTLTSDKEHDNQSKNYYTTSHNRMRVKQLYFLLCNSCFWCAPYLYLGKIMDRCPACNNDRLESMPICDKEIYKFGYDPKTEVMLEFSKNARVK
jgi:hypothetical protein